MELVTILGTVFAGVAALASLYQVKIGRTQTMRPAPFATIHRAGRDPDWDGWTAYRVEFLNTIPIRAEIAEIRVSSGFIGMGRAAIVTQMDYSDRDRNGYAVWLKTPPVTPTRAAQLRAFRLGAGTSAAPHVSSTVIAVKGAQSGARIEIRYSWPDDRRKYSLVSFI